MAVVFSDTFTAADGTTLQAHDATWVKNTADAPVDLLVRSGGIVLSSGTTASAYINTTAGSLTDQLVECDIVFAAATNGIHSVIARSATAARTYYLARFNAGFLQLYRFEAASVIKHGGDISVSVSVGQTHRLGLRCVGNQISLEWDGVTKIGPITDSTYSSGYPGVRVIEPSTVRLDNFSVDNLAAADTTAPTLTSPTASATGATTASGSVSTNEANGTLYYLASANATELVATVKAGSSQAVTAAGVQNVTVTGLTASTSYYLHFVHTDAAANDSTVATSGQFTTAAANTSPSFTGPNIADISGTEAVALTPADVSSLFFDSESGLTFSAIGSWPAGVTVSSAGVISGTPTTAGTYSGLQVRATDAGSLTADSNTFSITVSAAPAASTITVTEPLKNNTGTLLANLSGVRVAVLEAATLAGVYETSGLTTNASGLLAAITDAAITTGQQYHVVIKLADGGVGITGPITAS
jgi:hypothetical protein